MRRVGGALEAPLARPQIDAAKRRRVSHASLGDRCDVDAALHASIPEGFFNTPHRLRKAAGNKAIKPVRDETVDNEKNSFTMTAS